MDTEHRKDFIENDLTDKELLTEFCRRGLAQATTYKPERPTPEIPLETFLEAQRDPRVKRFLDEAREESQRFKLKGEIHL